MKINPMCDLLVGNRPENDSDTQYYECEYCYRYETCKKYGCIEACSLEETKEETPNIFEPSYDLLKQEGYFEMSMISELIKNLRWYGSYADSAKKDLMYEAADTIEALSAKPAEANVERPDRCYDVRKELVEQYNKAFELINKMPLEENEVWHGYVGGVMQTLGGFNQPIWIATHNRKGVDCIAGICNYSYLFNRGIKRQAIFKTGCIHRHSEYGRGKRRGV